MNPLRKKAMDALKKHKSGWLGLGSALLEISASNEWKDWGYEKFVDYCKEELGLTAITVNEMITAYEYIKNNEPATLNTLESDPDKYIPDYHTLASLSKARSSDRINDEKEDQIRDILFNAGADSAAAANQQARDLLAESRKGGEEIMADIQRKTASIKKRIKKLDSEIHNTSSFSNDIIEVSEKLTELILKVEV